MAHAIVRLENLCKQFGDVMAVDHVSLDIAPGEFVTLLGPSGCGKTTTLRMIAGLEMPTSGTIYLENQDVTHVPPEKRPVNMVFQAYALFPHLNIYENIAFGPRLKKWPEDRIQPAVDEMLRLVQLEGYGGRRPAQLSGGQSQRVALARALINHPKVLLLDEPLGALDLKLRKAMQLELRSIQQKLGMTFVYVTHDQEEAMVMSDRIVLMNGGKIVQIGAPMEIYNHPRTVFASRFIGESNLIEGRVARVDADAVGVDVGALTLTASPEARQHAAVGEDVVVSIRPERIGVYASREAAPARPNTFEGTVENAIFLGPVTRYHVRLSDDLVMIADGVSVNGTIGFPVGQTVAVGWDTTSSILLSS